jgi:hypothetical protein
MIEAFHTLDNGTLVDFALDTDQRLTIRAGMSLNPNERPVVLVLTPADAVMVTRILKDLFTAQPVDLSRLPPESER